MAAWSHSPGIARWQHSAWDPLPVSQPGCGDRSDDQAALGTRGERDCVTHLRRLVESAPEVKRWHVMMDNVDTHRSESLVRWVTHLEGIEQETLGVKGKRGILRSMESRTIFLHDPTHRVVFYYTPKHASWMNQVEIWLNIWYASCSNAAILPRSTTCTTKTLLSF